MWLKNYPTFNLMYTESSAHYVYICTNSTINPPCIKIGRGENVYKRMKSLSASQPGPWKTYYSEGFYSKEYASKVENGLHYLFSNANRRLIETSDECPGKEYFYACPEHVKSMFPVFSGGLRDVPWPRFTNEQIKPRYDNWLKFDKSCIKPYQELMFKIEEAELKMEAAEEESIQYKNKLEALEKRNERKESRIRRRAPKISRPTSKRRT